MRKFAQSTAATSSDMHREGQLPTRPSHQPPPVNLTPAPSASLNTHTRVFRPVSGCLAVLLLLCPAAADGFYDLGGGEVILQTTLTGGYDSNLFGRAGGEEDVFVSLAPTLSWIRPSGLAGLNASAGVNLTRYLDFSDQSFEDYFVLLSGGLPIPAESDLSGSFGIGYHRRTRLEELIFDRVTTDTFHGNLNARYQLAPRRYLLSSYQYTDEETARFNTVTHAGTIGFGFTEIFRHLDLSLNYRIRHTELTRAEGDRDHLDHAFYANLSGPILPAQWLPKVEVTFSLGFENTLPTVDDDRTRRRLTGSAAAAWQARPRTEVNLELRRDLELTPDQRNVESTSVQLRVNQGIGAKMKGNAFAGYTWSDFTNTGSDQETLRLGAGLTRNLNRNWDAGSNYAYTRNITDEALRDFDRHLMTIFLSHIF